MFGKINILDSLEKEQQSINTNRPIELANSILEEEFIKEKELFGSINCGDINFKGIDASHLNPNRVFSEEAIKNICVKYRLRFLDADLFKGEIPYEAIQQAKYISRESETNLKRFKIMAPSRLFKLADADADPLLFVPTVDGNYYLIHKWGTDLSWYKKLVHFPSRSLENLVLTILVCALLIAVFIPNEWLMPPSNMAYNGIFSYWGFHRVAFFFHSIILIGGITIFYWFAFHKNFSRAEWNRNTFN